MKSTSSMFRSDSFFASLVWGVMFVTSSCAAGMSGGDTDTDDDDGSSADGGGGGQAGAAGGENAAGADGEDPGTGGVGGIGETDQTGGSGTEGGAGGDGGAGETGGNSGGSAQGGSGNTVSAPPLFVNGFEEGKVGQAPPSPWTGGGPGLAVVDESKFWSGKRSLKVTSSGNEAMVSLLVTKILPAPRKTAYVRFMMWLNNFPGARQDGLGHWNLMEHKGVMKGDGFNIPGEISFGGFQEDKLKFQVFGDDTGGKGRLDCIKEDVMLLSVKEWQCVEMKIDEKAILNYGVSIDGMDVPSFSFIYDAATSICPAGNNITNDVWYIPEIIQTRFGWKYHPGSKQPLPVTLWIDDIVIDTKPIGCPQK